MKHCKLHNTCQRAFMDGYIHTSMRSTKSVSCRTPYSTKLHRNGYHQKDQKFIDKEVNLLPEPCLFTSLLTSPSTLHTPFSPFIMADATGTSLSSCKVVLAGTIAKSLLSEVQDGLGKLSQPPLLVGMLANDDPAAKLYADWTERTCLEKYAQAHLCYHHY